MATIAEQLTSVNTNISTINTEVGNQADLIAQIKAVANSLPDAGSSSGGSSEALEALGALCEWQVTTDSNSAPMITIVNYHPSYYLHFTVVEYIDGEVDDFYEGVVNPDDVHTEGFAQPLSSSHEIHIENVRWSANA